MQWQLIPETTNACLRHKCFTDNDRDQQTYGSDRSGPEKIPEMTENRHQILFPNVKTINVAVKTHVAGPEKLTINFVWPKLNK
jgi:hypothetical protein